MGDKKVNDAERDQCLRELDAAVDRWEKAQPMIRFMIERAAAKYRVQANRMMDAIIADREAKDSNKGLA